MYSCYLCTKDSRRAESLCPVSRVSVGEIESAVLLHIKKMLCTPTIVNQLARDLNTPGKEVAEVLNKLTPLWDEMFPAAFPAGQREVPAPLSENRRTPPVLNC